MSTTAALRQLDQRAMPRSLLPWVSAFYSFARPLETPDRIDAHRLAFPGLTPSKLMLAKVWGDLARVDF